MGLPPYAEEIGSIFHTFKNADMSHFQLNVQPGSYYAKFNGKNFPLIERVRERITLNIFGQPTDFTTKEAVEIHVFTCDVCGENKSHISNFTNGYGTDKDGRKTCFECCGKQDRADLLALPVGGRSCLYLAKDDNGQWSVSNWSGTLKIAVSTPRKGHHNIARTRYDVWFSLDGAQFHGVQYGEWTQICHVRRIKG